MNSSELYALYPPALCNFPENFDTKDYVYCVLYIICCILAICTGLFFYFKQLFNLKKEKKIFENLSI